MGGNPVEPCRERNPPPLKPPQVGQRMMKYLGGQVFRLRAISHPPHHVRIHPLEIVLVELREARRVLLRRLDQKPLVRFFPRSPQEVAFNGFSARSSVRSEEHTSELQSLRHLVC